MDRDISRILKSWEYQPDTLIIRKVAGDDGNDKIQIRINLGILQMEAEGRPDGKTPHSSESLLEYYDSIIEEFGGPDRDGDGFALTRRDMRDLDDELMQYYQRRVCFFALEDYRYARRDAEHNLKLMDLIKKYCTNSDYVESHERFRPFIMMERARAAGLESIDTGNYADAMRQVGSTIGQIERFHMERGVSEYEMQKSRELIILKKWRNQIHRDWEGGVTEIEEDDDNGDDEYEDF